MKTEEIKSFVETDLSTIQTRSGGCHCGAVRYEATLSLDKTVSCNYSICTKAGYVLAFVPADQFKLIAGDDKLRDYQFNKKIAHHVFCTDCGIHSFSHGRSPDGREMRAINLRCLDDIAFEHLGLRVAFSALRPKPRYRCPKTSKNRWAKLVSAPPFSADISKA